MPRAVDWHDDPSDLEKLRDAMHDAIAEGLGADGQAVAALPVYFAPTTPQESSDAVVLDAGGTHARAAHVRWTENQGITPVGDVGEMRLPGRDGPVSQATFFDAQAELIKACGAPADAPVGYCFSYPAASTADGDAELLRWTKGIEVPDTVGRPVGALLAAALARTGLHPNRIRVLNDTVAALFAGAAQAAPGPSLGLIAGTGTNMAIELPAARVPKCGGSDGSIAINLESGNFRPPGLQPFDDAVDAESRSPGRQRFEKAVSGHYLPLLLRALHPEAPAAVRATSAADLVALRTGSDAVARSAGRLLDRAARWLAAGAAGAIAHLPGDAPVQVVAEGSLFWKTPGFAAAFGEALRTLTPRSVTTRHVPHANLVGAGLAALSD